MRTLLCLASAIAFAVLSVGAATAADWVSAPSGVKATDRVQVTGEVAGATEVTVTFTSPAGAKETRRVRVVDGKFNLEYIPGMPGQHQIVVKSGKRVVAKFLMGV